MGLSAPSAQLDQPAETAPLTLPIWLRYEEMTREGKGSGVAVEAVSAVLLDVFSHIDLRDLISRIIISSNSGYAWVEAYYDRLLLARFRGGFVTLSPAGMARLADIRRWNEMSVKAGDGVRPTSFAAPK